MDDYRKSILKKTNYFKKCNEMLLGSHGPEEKNGEVYISIYHYLEFLNLRPSSYNTVKLGGYLSDLAGDDKIPCQYSCQNFEILKFPVALLLERRDDFKRFLKDN